MSDQVLFVDAVEPFPVRVLDTVTAANPFVQAGTWLHIESPDGFRSWVHHTSIAAVA